MNSKQAKLINLPQLMSKMGYEPSRVKKGGNEYWYRSPFREEKQASFHTSYLGGKWIWKDFGDRGGTVIDFVMRHEGYTQISDALRFLERIYQGGVFLTQTKQKSSSFQQQDNLKSQNLKDNRELLFLKAQPVSNPVIYAYLNKRGIPRNLVNHYLEEIHYRNKKTGKTFYAFGMKNESDGYEIRAATDAYQFKSALKKRDITLIQGNETNSQTVNVFEGMTDFLSLLVMLNSPYLSGDSIIMHSLSSFKHTIETIQTKRYQKVNTFLDNNKSGKAYTEKFQKELGSKVIPQNELFAPHEDLNDALRANPSPDFLKR